MTMKTIGIYGLTHELLGHDWDYWLLTIVILWYLSGIHGDFAPVVYRVYLSYWGWLPRRSSNDCSRCAIAHNCTRISWHGHICLGWFMTCMALVGLKQSADALSASWRFIQFRWTIQSQWMSVVILASLLFQSLDWGKICRKPWFLPLNMGVSCKFSLKPIHWSVHQAAHEATCRPEAPPRLSYGQIIGLWHQSWWFFGYKVWLWSSKRYECVWKYWKYGIALNDYEKMWNIPF